MDPNAIATTQVMSVRRRVAATSPSLILISLIAACGSSAAPVVAPVPQPVPQPVAVAVAVANGFHEAR